MRQEQPLIYGPETSLTADKNPLTITVIPDRLTWSQAGSFQL